jgi:ankyrin repeat protein
MVQRCAVKRSSRIFINAIRKKDVDAVAKFLKYGTNVIAVDYEGNSPVHHAVLADNTKILELLLTSGAEVETVNDAGLRPYDIAVDLKNVESLEMLLKHRAKINIDDFGRDLRELPKELVNLFYKYVDAKDVCFLGYTALHHTVKLDDLNGVRLLISKGADVNKPSVYEGYMPLHLAKSAKCVELLIQNGAEANIKDKYACTPLYTTALKDKFSMKDKSRRVEQGRMIKILFENGADGIDVIYAGQIDLDYGRDWDSMCGLRNVLKYMALLEDKHQYTTKIDFRFNDSTNELSSFYKKCLAEVTQLKETIIFGGLSVFNFARKSVQDLSYCMCNRKILDLFHERRSQYQLRFPIYFEILEQHFADAMERRNLWHSASTSLCNIVRCIDRCHIVTQRILEFLTTEDMQCLIAACPVNTDCVDR